MRTALGFLALLAASLTPAGAYGAVAGEGTHKTARAVRAPTPPVIDGRLDDAVWQLAPVNGDFHQNEPREGAPATETTTFRVLYDDHALYVGIYCQDRERARRNAPLTRRDLLNESDTVWVQIDSQHDHTSGFTFALTASGVQIDARLYDDWEFSSAWDAVWEGEVADVPGGWAAELAIPLTALRFDPTDGAVWGFNIVRYLPRAREDASWVWWPAATLDARVSRLGHLEGLTGLRPRRAFELRPYVVTRLGGASPNGGFLGSDGGDTESQLDAGVDLKLGLASDLTFDATVNPDFGQVEADPSVLNLSRFETQFPERRPFFLEGFDLFRTPAQLFYTRRIGQGSNLEEGDTMAGHQLLETPRPPRILAAAKVSGRATPRLSVGALTAITGEETVSALTPDGRPETLTTSPARAFGVVRARWAVDANGSFVGIASTNVARLSDSAGRARADHDAYTQAFDAVFRSGGGRLTVTAQGVVSERVGGPSEAADDGGPCVDGVRCEPIARADGVRLGPGQVGSGATLRADVQGKRWTANGNVASVSPTLNLNDAGFAQEWNQHLLHLEVGLRETQGQKLQNYGVLAFHNSGYRWDGLPTFANVGLNPWFTTRGFFHVWADVGFRFIKGWDPFDAGDGARAERTRLIFSTLGFATNGAKAIAAEGSVGLTQRFDEGPTASANVTVTARSGPVEGQLAGELLTERDQPRFYSCEDPLGFACSVATTERSYVWADLASRSLSLTARLAWTFSTRVSLQTYAQLFMSRGSYDDLRGADTTGTHPVLHPRTFTPLGAAAGDTDGDGIGDANFQDVALDLNVVVRWEPVRGTTLLGVYTRAVDADSIEPGVAPHLTSRGLGSGAAADVLLAKLVLYVD